MNSNYMNNLSSIDGHEQTWAILLAAGSGTRLTAATNGLPKQFLHYLGAPLYWRCALTMSRAACIDGLIFVFPQDTEARESEQITLLNSQSALGIPWRTVSGGHRRQDSVRNGIEALPPQCSYVLIHDTARPFASANLVVKLHQALQSGLKAVIPAVAVTDTIKIIANDIVTETPDRNSLCAVQTPQAFDLSLLRAAHKQAQTNLWTVTDDASLLERCGTNVHIIEGENANRKITTPEDLQMLKAQEPPMMPCTGMGYDVHRFGPGRPLKLGGVLIPSNLEVQAHSDGDVLLHALMDAILGCACAGDIGQHFSDTSATFDNIDSTILLDDVLQIAHKKGVRMLHADLTVITQKPKIAPYSQAIRANISRLTGIHLEHINIKATTEEGLGFTGSGEGIKATAIVTAMRTDI